MKKRYIGPMLHALSLGAMLLIGDGLAVASTPFDAVIESVVAGNSALRATKARGEGEVESRKAEASLENPDVEFEHLWSAGAADNKWNIGITQGFAWPGVYSSIHRAAQANRLAQSHLYDEELQQLKLKAGLLMADIVAANRQVEILGEIAGTMQQLRSRYERAWQLGECTILDLNKIKIEALRAEGDFADVVDSRRRLLGELSALAENSSVEAAALEATEFPCAALHPLEVYMQAVDQAPELLYMAQMSRVAQANESIAKASRLPGFSIGYRHAFEEGTHFNGLAVAMTLPVWSRRSAVKAAGAASAAMSFDIAARRVAMERSIEADYQTAAATASRIAALTPEVEGVNNLNLLKKALDGGELSLLSYLQEVGYFLTARLELVELNRTHLKSLLALNSYLTGAAN